MAGRKPTPSNLHVLHGNPGRRPLNKSEPQPEACIPDPPEHLTERALREWHRVAPGLEALGILSEIDRAALAIYCQAWGRLVEAEEKLEQYGQVVKSPSGYPMQSPYLAISNAAAKQVQSFATEFGMTPSSRTRIRVNPKREKDEFEEFLDGA